MEVAFSVALIALLWFISVFPRSALARIAFSWYGPTPRAGEAWARYQVRWAFYSLDWLGQIALVFALFYGAAYFYPGIVQHPLFMAFAGFALPIGAGMALLAAVGFFLKAAKARYIGPNPVALMEEDEPFATYRAPNSK